MEYQKIINLLDNTPNQPTRFRTKKWVEMNDDARGTYHTNSKFKFKTSMLKSSLFDYSEVQILVSRTIIVEELAAGKANNGVEVVFKNCNPFADCISEINKKPADKAKDIDVVI